jgi:predicted porin
VQSILIPVTDPYASRAAIVSGKQMKAITGLHPAFLALSAGYVATSASAQSSLALYGVIDDAVAYTNNQHGRSDLYLLQGSLSSSRLALRGSEALSSHTKAISDLQAGFDPNTGKEASPGLEFNRQALFGVEDETLGSILLGRQYSSYWTLLFPLGPVPSLTGATGTHPGDIDALDTTVRANNSVKYISAPMAGITTSVQYGLGGVPGSLHSGSEVSGALQYVGGPLSMAVGYLRLNNVNTSDGFNSTTGSSIGVSAINTGYLTARSIQHLAVLMNYERDPILVGLSYFNVAYRPDASSAFTGTAVFNTYGFIARYALAKKAAFAVGYSYTMASRANGISDAATYHQISMKQSYQFSKRTTVYFIQAWQRANGQTLDSSGTRNIVNASSDVGDAENSTPSSTESQVVAAFGLAVAF